MAILTRLGHLLRADAHAVLDQVEDPTTSLRQAIRDMEDSLAVARQELQRTEGRRDVLEQQRNQLLKDLDNQSRRIDVCFAEGAEPLAKSVLRQRLTTERRLELLAERLAATDVERAAQSARIDEQSAALDSVRQQYALLDPDGANPSETRRNTPAGPGPSISDADVDVAYLEALRRWRADTGAGEERS